MIWLTSVRRRRMPSPPCARPCAPLWCGRRQRGGSACPPARATPWRRGCPARPWPCPEDSPTCGPGPGEGSCWGWRAPCCWGGWPGRYAAAWRGACAPPPPCAAGGRSPGRRLWPSSTGLRTGRSFWGSFS